VKFCCVFQVNGVGKTAGMVEYPERPGQPLCEVIKPILKLFLIDIFGQNILFFYCHVVEALVTNVLVIFSTMQRMAPVNLVPIASLIIPGKVVLYLSH